MAIDTPMPGAGNARFPDTPWTTILAQARLGQPLRAEVLDQLAHLYWRPVYFWFRRRWNRSPEDAKDLTQEIFARLMTLGDAAVLDPSRGKLRLYLKAAADNLVRKGVRDGRRLKRGGGRRLVQLDAVDESQFPSPSGIDDCERQYDVEWAKSLIQRGLDTLQERLRPTGKQAYAEVLRFYDLAPDERPSYEGTARQFGLTVEQVRGHLRYARSLLRTILREHLAESLEHPADLDIEYEHLFGQREPEGGRR